MIDSIPKLIQQAHSLAKEKGWWDDERLPAELVCLFHSEISEAFEEYRMGKMATYYTETPQGCKPEGFWVEIADLCIRIGDLMGRMGWVQKRNFARLPRHFQSSQFLFSLHRQVADLIEDGNWNFRGNTRDRLTRILETCLLIAERHDVELWEIIDLKHQYNETRPYRHGGKRA